MVVSSKYWKLLAGIIKHTDIVIEVVDARCPRLSRNPALENMIKGMNKELIIVINKTDLVSYEFAEEMKEDIEKEHQCIFMSAIDRLGTSYLRNIISIVRKKKHYSDEKEIYISIVGYPNVGKSSIINSLKGKKVASTSPMPGHTKGEQWIKFSKNIRFSDTPGIIHQKETINMIKGVAKIEETGDIEDETIEMLNTIMNTKNNLAELYKIDEKDPSLFLQKLTEKRGCLLKGGIPDTIRMCKQIVTDWNRGRITAEIRDELSP